VDKQVLSQLQSAGGMAAVAAVGLTLAWLVILFRVPPPEGDASDRLAHYARRPSLLLAHFVPATLIAVAYVLIWVGLAAHLWTTHAFAAVLSVAFGILYVPLVLVGYTLQYTTARAIAEHSSVETERWLTAWRIVSFADAPESATGWLVVLGYAVWGIGAAFAAAGLVAESGGLEIATACALAVTALLAWVGAGGVVARNRFLQRAVLASGVTSVAATGLIAALLLN
jgi:hypothetical protein